MTYQQALQFEKEHPQEISQAVWDFKTALEWEARRAVEQKEERCFAKN
jgi:hypothetical protein